MVYSALAGLMVILPLVVIISGKAITPVLGVMVLLMLWASFRPALCRADAKPLNAFPLLVTLGLVLIWPLVSSLWSLTPARSASTTAAVAVLCALGGLAYLRVPKLQPPSDTVLLRYSYCMAGVSALVLLEVLPSGGLIRLLVEALGMDYARYSEKNINRGLCALAVLVWPAVLGLHGMGKLRHAWGLLALVALPLLFMQSLSAQLGIAVGLLVCVLVMLSPRFMPWLLALGCLAVLALFPLLFAWYDEALQQAGVYAYLPETAQLRLTIWRFVLERITENPWLGWGMDTSRAMPGGKEIVILFGKPMEILPLHPHNTSLQLVLELGAVGLALMVMALGFVLYQWIRCPEEARIQRASGGALIMGYVAAGYASFGVWQSWWLATLWVGALLWQWVAQKPLTSKPRSL